MKASIIAVVLGFAVVAQAQPNAAVPSKTEPGTPTVKTTTAPVKPEADPWANRNDLFALPDIKPATTVSLGALSRASLPNGLELIVVPRGAVPSVEVTLAVRLSETAEPIEKAGLAQFVAGMLRKGTQKRSADQISDAIDSVGGALGATATGEGIIISCHARARDLGLCLDLVGDVAMNASFPEGEMGEIRQQLEATINQAKDDPGTLAQWHLANVFYGDDDPRGRPMSKRSLDGIDQAALKDFHDKWFAPNNAILAVSGDFDAKDLRKRIDKELGGWKKHEVPSLAEHDPRPIVVGKSMPVRLVDKSEATQSHVEIVGPGIRHSDPDLYAVRLMNYSLGGGAFSSRLMKVVRSEGGKTYHVHSAFEVGRDPGPFEVGTFTRNAETAGTIKLVLDEIAKMRASGPTQAELTAAKNNLIGGYGLHLETGEDLASNLIGAELDGLDAEFVAKYPERLNAVTLDDAKRAAAKHLDPRALVIVGRASEVGPMLKKAGYAKIEVVNWLDPVSTAERHAILAKRSAAAQVIPAEAMEGKRLIDVALKAQGGAAALEKVKTLDLKGDGTLSAQGQTMNAAVEVRMIRGSAIRQDMDLNGQQMTLAFAGGKGTIRSGSQAMAMPPDAAAEMRKSLFRDEKFILLNAATDPNAKARGLKPLSAGGVTYDIVEVISPENDITRLWLDQKTHLIARMTYTEEGKQVVDELSDYRAVQGVQLPFKTKHDAEIQKIEVSYKSIEINPKLAPDLFK
jgi:zinc protease